MIKQRFPSSGKDKTVGRQTPKDEAEQMRKRVIDKLLHYGWGRFFPLFHPYESVKGKLWHSESIFKELTSTTSPRLFVIIRYEAPQEKDGYGYQLFYCSSGANSLMKGTWYPCDGFMVSRSQEGDKEVILKSIYVKLGYTFFSQQMVREYKLIDDLLALSVPKLTTSTDVMETCLGRFGTSYFLYVSYVLGGGIWNHEGICRVLGDWYSLPLIPFPRSWRDRWDISHLTVLPSPHHVNDFAKYALSINYCKQEYSPRHTPSSFVDLQKWRKGGTTWVGNEEISSSSSVVASGAGCQRNICIYSQGNGHGIPYLFELVLFGMNINQTKCSTFDYLKSKLESEVARFGVK